MTITTRVSEERLRELSADVESEFIPEGSSEWSALRRQYKQDHLAALRELRERRALMKECEAYLQHKDYCAMHIGTRRIVGKDKPEFIAAALLLSQQARLESSQAECKDALATAERNNALVNELQARVQQLSEALCRVVTHAECDHDGMTYQELADMARIALQRKD